ncbi:hypothetical protein QN357_01460 [Cryobacterium sp. RTC2.1]|uniref:hypothetical protein n=1 Tax=Cryobacterium sp. RTC2.1 TaxID=3048634 RepID=UPI002B22428B|nr:hypothetical protein [Cryobacterium sp. RTC2.1]MEB0001603.1 hypothetical protein [Cryobacterium sp. RTC2.1]
MPKYRNVSPLGDLDTPIVGRIVEAGEVIELPAERAVFLVGQDETWEPADDEARALANPEPTPPDTAPTADTPAEPPASTDTNGEPVQ